MSENRRVGRAEVLANVAVAQDIHRMRIRTPLIAEQILPGQFVMVRSEGSDDPLLARPYALYDTFDDESHQPAGIDIVYLVVGKGTKALARLRPGDAVQIWGPLGNSFPRDLPLGNEERVLLVAGGIGQTPFPAVALWLSGAKRFGREIVPAANRPNRVEIAYGARTASSFAELDDFHRTCSAVHLATDDGSVGHRGYVTEVVENLLNGPSPPTAIFGCGPVPMLNRLADIADRHGVRCWVSLETKMACGYGVCFSCVCPIGKDDDFDYRRVCLEGSVFDARTIAWGAL